MASAHSTSRSALVLVGLWLAGLALRIVWALRSLEWNAAPDQLAWQLLIAESRAGAPRADQLFHYPHEGGSFFLGVLARALPARGFGLPSLTWAALLADALGRALAMWAIDRAFGRRAALFLGAWLVAALPGVLPWSVVNYGLHGLASVWPFVFLLVASGKQEPRALRLGVIAGLAVAWSYDSVALLAAGLVWTACTERRRAPAFAAFLLGAAVPIALHLGMRATLDLGFHLEDHGAFGIRGVELVPTRLNQWPSLWWKSWWSSLPGATLLPAMGGIHAMVLRRIWVGLAVALSIAVLMRGTAVARLGALILAVYSLAYAVSPFARFDPSSSTYVPYRHLAYLLPLLAAMALTSAARWRRAGLVLAVLLCLPGIAALVVAPPTRSSTRADRAAGWILAAKLGHDPARLERLLSVAEPSARQDLALGYGWGYAALLLQRQSAPASAEIERIGALTDRFTPETHAVVARGTALAFLPGATPTLDPSLAPLLDRRLELRQGAFGGR